MSAHSEPAPETDPEGKLSLLESLIRRYGTLGVAFSGGVDSAFLLDAAAEALGAERVVAATVRGVNFPQWEGGEARDFAARLGVRHIVIPWDAMSLPEFAQNGPRRCYHCKKAVFGAALAAVRELGIDTLADGTNADDAGDYRPGGEAATELGVVSPLRECGFGKADIRAQLRKRGLPLWEKPSFACLASRIPYGEPITEEALRRIERAEEFLHGLGFAVVRVRHHGALARLELGAAEMSRFLREEKTLRAAVDRELRRLGYAYVALDLRGYRSGSLNETL